MLLHCMSREVAHDVVPPPDAMIVSGHDGASRPPDAIGTNPPCQLPLGLVRKLGLSCPMLPAGHRLSAMEGRPSVAGKPSSRQPVTRTLARLGKRRAQPADGSAATVSVCCERENSADFFSRPQVSWGMLVKAPRGAPEGSMLDWLTWPADQLLRIGGVVAGWFFSKDAISFTAVQMMFATIVLAAFIALIVFWQSVIEYCRSLWKSR